MEREASPLKMIEYIELSAQITEHGLPLAERLERIMQHSPEDVDAYLTSLAKQDTQRDLSSFEEAMMLVHGATDFFEPFAKPMTATLMNMRPSPIRSSSRAKNRSANTSVSSMMRWVRTITS